MPLFNLLTAKPVLIGLHLGFAIIGIDAFLWLLGELIAGVKSRARMVVAASIGVATFLLSWLAGGYYYVKFYGTLVKPTILGGLAPWAHSIVMETKEHIFLFITPLAFTAFFAAMMGNDQIEAGGLRKSVLILVGFVAGLGLLIGLMGFVISAAARWGM